MLQNPSTIQNKYKNFVTRVVANERLYALENNKGYATSYSNRVEDENGDPIEMICFWSDESLAKSCIEKEWRDYQVSPLLLSEFLENWCVGMCNDGLMVGIDFDKNLFGDEIEPLKLILDILSLLIDLNKNISFKKYRDINELYNQAKELL
ncbi:DUF2750 domain-containing protein [Apibacter muscae]|uniref:DUF2750 domain-containing protein n=1 Tax=Apibacter muscae TaxID=2509004 RepID=UPI0011AC4722|nr:DUF2750 domain-containing protein [Apibacter muscae]TWP30186.1 DUF2750 domain-containing protein [Apibacter muscae]